MASQVILQRLDKLQDALGRMETVFKYQISSRKILIQAIRDGLRVKTLGHNALAKRARISPSYLSEILSGKQAGPRADRKLIQAGQCLARALKRHQQANG